MNFWRKEMTADAADYRADVIIQKKRRKQDPQAKGLAAVAIARRGPRSVHQRNEDRHVLEGTTAKAQIDGEEHSVKLLNLSSNGVMIGFEGTVAIGQEVRLAIADCAPISTAVRWVRRDRIGLEFLAETVLIAEAGLQDFILKTIAQENSASGASSNVSLGAEKRGVSKRHQLVWVAKLQWGKREATVRLRNISASGAMIALSDGMGPDEGSSVSLFLETAGKVRAKVRWAIDRQYGLEFLDGFDISQLIDERCVELAPADDSSGLASPVGIDNPTAEDFDVLRIRLGNVQNPHQPPNMTYGRLTLDEVYTTLYPQGRP